MTIYPIRLACTRPCRSLAAALILSILSFGALAGGVIDFGYRVSRDGSPVVRAYDDGRRTYLVLAGGAAPGAVRLAATAAVIRQGQVSSAPLDLSQPYPSIPGVYDRIVLSFGGRETVITYVGSRNQAVEEEIPPEELPLIEVGEPLSVHKTPVQEVAHGQAREIIVREADHQAAPVPVLKIQPAAAPPAKEAPQRNAIEKEVLPDNQVVRVTATNQEAAIAVPAASAARAAAPTDGDVAEYKVLIPFLQGKTALGKEGEKAMLEVAQIGPIAREIRIRAPFDPGRDLQRAYGRAAEIHRQLIKAGLGSQRVSFEAFDAVPNGKVVNGEVALIVDLAPKAKE